MAKLTRKQLDEEIKFRFLEGVSEHLENCGEEVLRVKSNEIALPVVDSDGEELVAWNAQKGYNSVVVSCPEIEDGGKYTLKTGETTTEITMDGLIYGSGSGFGGGMHGGWISNGGNVQV